MAATANLPSLPVELLYQISEQLSYGSHIALSFTCRELYIKLDTRRRLPPAMVRGKAYTMNDLLEIEAWPEHNPQYTALLPSTVCPVDSVIDFLACRVCLKIRRTVKFPDHFGYYDQPYSVSQWERSVRICRSCATCKGRERNGITEHLEAFSREPICGWCFRLLEIK